MFLIIKLHEGDVHRADITVNRADGVVQLFESKDAAEIYVRQSGLNAIVVEYAKPEKQFSFWKLNRLDRRWAATESFLKTEFREYLDRKQIEWLNHWGSSTVATHFIADQHDGGLNSAMDQGDVQSIVDLLRPVFIEYMDEYQKSLPTNTAD